MYQHATTSKDAALQAVGRTVVNFQRLEHNLKLASRLGPLGGTLSKIQRDIAKRVERAATLSLGQAIQAWLTTTNGELIATSYTPDLFDITMQMTFCLDMDTESRNAHGAALKSLLETRNKLIHGGLVQVQWDSPDACDQLVVELDRVNESISRQLEFVTSILSAFSKIRPEDIEAALKELSRQMDLVEKAAGDA